MDDSMGDQFPALRARRDAGISPQVDQTRRVLWRAFQHGELTEDEFARTLAQLEPARGHPESKISEGDPRHRS